MSSNNQRRARDVRHRSWLLGLTLALFALAVAIASGCSQGASGERVGGNRSALAQGTPVTTDALTYAAPATVNVTYSGLPGNPRDWVAIAVEGSAPTSFLQWSYTNGAGAGDAGSGMASFTNIAAGNNYVARTFVNDTFTMSGESAAFNVTSNAPAVTTSASSYASGASVTANYVRMPGNPRDWIAIAVPGAPTSSYVAWQYTNGTAAGSSVFATIPDGRYVARAFTNDTFNQVAESAPFTVGNAVASVTTDATTYTQGATVTVNYSGLPGNQRDWIAIANSGSADTSFVAWFYTNGATSGSQQFTQLLNGSYVARAFANDTFTKLGESPVFTIASTSPAVAASASNYATGATAIANYSNLPGNQRDWIAVTTPGAANTSYIAWTYTAGARNGSANFAGLADGTYVFRAYVNDSFTVLAESPTFTIGGAVDAGSDAAGDAAAQPAVTTDLTVYASGGTVTASWTNLPGNQLDWIAIAPANAPDTTYVRWIYTYGRANGSNPFSGIPDGTWVARAYLNDSYTRLAQSAQFTVGSADAGTD